MAQQDESIHNRKSPRAKWSEYAGGLYFITIVTKDRIHYFGKICNGEIQYFHSGKVALSTIDQIETIFPYCKMINSVVMPNHIHLVLYIDENKIPYSKRKLNIVNDNTLTINKATKCFSWLSHVISHFKSYITRCVHEQGIEFEWQQRYHDHIIRNMRELEMINNYINNNVTNWETDCFCNNKT